MSRRISIVVTGFAVVVVGLVTSVRVAHAQQGLPPRQQPGTLQDQRPAPPDRLRKYDTRYYVMFTDLGEDHAREASIRTTRMAEEYYERTKGFSGKIRTKFPFYLFQSEQAYYNAGGMPGTAGVFMGSPRAGFKLMALAGEKPDATTWQTVQHEGFHQFAHAVIGGDLPIWVNEGLAEYFGEGLFTGDGFVTGVVPPWRLQRIKATFAANKFLPIEQMMTMTHAEWNMRMSGANYDQAWAMVHFLAHAEDGKYQEPFSQFMNLIGRDVGWRDAWMQTFKSPKGFEDRWRKYWTELPENATEHLYARASLETMASFLARASIEGQTFENFDAFKKASQSNQLKIAEANWLPPVLLSDAVKRSEKIKGDWRLDGSAKPPRLLFVMDDRTQLVAIPTLDEKTVEKISVITDDLPKALTEARRLMTDGKRSEARALMQEAVKRNAKSPLIDEGRQLLNELRGGGAKPDASKAP